MAVPKTQTTSKRDKITDLDEDDLPPAPSPVSSSYSELTRTINNAQIYKNVSNNIDFSQMSITTIALAGLQQCQSWQGSHWTDGGAEESAADPATTTAAPGQVTGGWATTTTTTSQVPHVLICAGYAPAGHNLRWTPPSPPQPQPVHVLQLRVHL